MTCKERRTINQVLKKLIGEIDQEHISVHNKQVISECITQLHELKENEQ